MLRSILFVENKARVDVAIQYFCKKIKSGEKVHVNFISIGNLILKGNITLKTFRSLSEINLKLSTLI